jgi:NNP family nitrate/nitrite transporter-like MFS transporter
MNNNTHNHPPMSYGATEITNNGQNHDDSSDDSYEIRPSHSYPISLDYKDDDSDNDDDNVHPSYLSERLLARAATFSLPHDVDRGYRGTRLELLSFQRPHMRAFHGSWMCFFLSCFLQFAMCPLLPEIQASLNLTKSDVWLTNIYSMVGGIPMGFLLGALCDQYGARILITTLLAACAIPCLLTGLVHTLHGLILVRTIMGSMDTFVPGQYWITCCFTRQVVGTAMAISGGWGASGAGFVQLIVGTVIYPIVLTWTHGNSDLAWRISLIPPALIALYAAYFFYFYSDDCPLGNYKEVKKAGLMMERSAVDSFRSGALNVNSWILFLQYVS